MLLNQKPKKIQWVNLLEEIDKARKGQAKDVMRIIYSSKLISIPPRIEDYYTSFIKDIDYEYPNCTLQEIMNIPYIEFINAIDFLQPEAIFSTNHGVKGEEYDNVIFVISRGWNNYQFDTYMPMDANNIPSQKKEAYERNRNLFYVCCSRSKRKLVLFISIEVNGEFENYLKHIFGNENIITYQQLPEIN